MKKITPMIWCLRNNIYIYTSTYIHIYTERRKHIDVCVYIHIYSINFLRKHFESLLLLNAYKRWFLFLSFRFLSSRNISQFPSPVSRTAVERAGKQRSIDPGKSYLDSRIYGKFLYLRFAIETRSRQENKKEKERSQTDIHYERRFEIVRGSSIADDLFVLCSVF